MCGIFSGEFQCLPVDNRSAVSCDSGVLARGSESTSFYATIFKDHIFQIVTNYCLESSMTGLKVKPNYFNVISFYFVF